MRMPAFASGGSVKYIVALSLLLSVAASAAPAHSMSTAERQIRHSEQELNDALSAVDVKTIDKIWAEDFVFVNPSGRISNKAKRMAGLKPSDPTTPPLVSTIED